MTVYVDTHCHLDRLADPQGALRSATSARVVTVAVTNLPSQFQLLRTRLVRHTFLRIALGFHPLQIPPNAAHELGLFRQFVERTEYIGEVGLDYSRSGLGTNGRQRDVLERILQTPSIRRKVLTVHSRGAETDTIALLAQARVNAILHWYSGPLRAIDDALDAGLYFSINPAMAASEKGRRVLERLPHDRVLTETDAPYTKLHGRSTEPSSVREVVIAIARQWGVAPDEARDTVMANMVRLSQRARETNND